MAGDDTADDPAVSAQSGSGSASGHLARPHVLSAAQLARISEQSPLGMALVSLTGHVDWANLALATMLARDVADLLSTGVRSLIHPDDRDSTARVFGDLASGRASTGDFQARLLRSDGSTIWTRVIAGAVLDDGARAGGIYAIALQVVDVSEQMRAEEARRKAEAAARKALTDLRHRSTHDTLTGLLNRRALLSALDRMLTETIEHGSGVAVLFCDLDNLKEINDSVSHEAGDAILIQLADSLRRSLRANDLVGRVGGDEFVVVLRDVADPDLAAVIAEQIRDRAATGLDALVGLRVPSGVSIGVRLAVGGIPAAQVLRDADAALHEAKASGRNQIVVFDKALRDRIERKREVRTLLAAAIEADQVHAWFQPVVDLDSRAVVGYEALARWVRDDRVLDAGEWIEAVVDTSLIGRVGEIVIEETIRRLAALADPLWIAVNVSAREIGTPNFVTRLVRDLDRNGVAPGRFVVEVTESVVMDREIVRRQLDALVDGGIRVLFDDFGTGYASLNHLHTLPVSGVKLDRTFTQDLRPGQDTMAIVRGMAGLAVELGLSGVAEGIETPAQAEALRSAGWQYGQGYLFGHATA